MGEEGEECVVFCVGGKVFFLGREEGVFSCVFFLVFFVEGFFFFGRGRGVFFWEGKEYTKLVFLCARKLKKKIFVLVFSDNSQPGMWDNLAEEMLIGIRTKRMFNFACYKSIVWRSTQKQRPWKIVNTLCRFGNG